MKTTGDIMAYLLGGLFLVFFFLSGPVAFIWCIVLNNRVRRLEDEKILLEQKSWELQQREAKRHGLYSHEQRSVNADAPHPPALPSRDLQSILQQSKSTALHKETVSKETMQQPPSQHTSPPISAVESPKPAQHEPTHTSPQPQPANADPHSTMATHDNRAAREDSPFSWQQLELWIGRNLLGWVAVAAFVLAATFLIRYAVVEGWIGRIPAALKVSVIALFGGAFLVTGKFFALRGWRRFSTMLSSAGILIIFQAGYATFGWYELLSLSAAGVLMSLIVLGSFLLAWHYKSRLLGFMAILGGLAVPLLLRSEADHYAQFFTYLVILNLGTVMLVNLLRRAPALGLFAFLGTQAEFWLWHGEHYVYPEKLVAALLFQSAFYFVYLLDTSIASSFAFRNKKRRPTWDDATRAVIAPIVFFGGVWLLLHQDPVLGDWLGIGAFIGAAWYALLAVLYGKHLKRIWNEDADKKLSPYWKAGPTAATVIALSFVGIAIPLHFDAAWIALGWTTVFAGLWYFGNRQDNKAFYYLSTIFAGLGFFRVMHDIFRTRNFPEANLPWPVLNEIALPCLAVALAIIIVTVLTDRVLHNKNEEDRKLLNFSAGLVGFFLLAATLSVESVQFFSLRSAMYRPSAHWASLSLTVLWTVLAAILTQTGIIFRSKNLRVTALIGLVLVAVKFFAVDCIARGQTEFSHPNTFCNPYGAGLLSVSILYIILAVQSRLCKNREESEQQGWGVIGIAGIFGLLAILSLEGYFYFVQKPFVTEPEDVKTLQLVALGTLSVLWTLYGGLLMLLGLSLRSSAQGGWALRNCGAVVFVAALFKIIALEIFQRPDYPVAFANPYFVTMLCPALAVMLLPVWTVWFRPLENATERDGHRALGVAGLLLLWVILSVECFAHFDQNPMTMYGDRHIRFVATASLSMLWSALAATLLVLGLACRSAVLRTLGFLGLAATVVKMVGFELFRRPDFETALLNPYFLCIFVPATLMIGFAVWTTRFRPLENAHEKNGFLALGLVGVVLIWLAASVECFEYFNIRVDWPNHRFLASTALTVFWTVLGVILALVAATMRSKALRILSIALLMLTVFKVLPFDLSVRPEYVTPFLNPYALPPTVMALALIGVCVGFVGRLREENMLERKAYTVLVFLGVVLLWFTLSLECFRAVRLLQDAEHEAWKAQMALSILWSVFAGVLLFIGFVWRSAVLRWMAILLFALTSTKVLIVDMAGVHELYRFGAFFVLAIVLMLAAWAYQRFRPEKTPR